jgi:hypothetical protein
VHDLLQPDAYSEHPGDTRDNRGSDEPPIPRVVAGVELDVHNGDTRNLLERERRDRYRCSDPDPSVEPWVVVAQVNDWTDSDIAHERAIRPDG